MMDQVTMKECIDPFTGIREIFMLCLSGLGPSQIAKRLTAEGYLNPTAYQLSKGRNVPQKAPENPYRWSEQTIASILERRMKELDVLFQRSYEDNVAGKLSDERFAKLSATYDAEQEGLAERVKVLAAELETAEQRPEGRPLARRWGNKCQLYSWL